MAFTDSVTTVNLNDLIEFDRDARVVRKKIVQSEIIVSEIVCYEPGQLTKTHHHPHQDEIFYCMQGKGVVTFSERDDIPIEQGSVVFVPSGIEHGVETVGGERLVLVFAKGPGIPNPDRRKKSQ